MTEIFFHDWNPYTNHKHFVLNNTGLLIQKLMFFCFLQPLKRKNGLFFVILRSARKHLFFYFFKWDMGITRINNVSASFKSLDIIDKNNMLYWMK